MTYEEVNLSLQLLAEETVGASIRAKNREKDEKFEESLDRLRHDTQQDRL